ncbi:MAG TPA: hypothetical protein VHN11_13295, partial [Xanthobacteraceae bacterium]|nr:hypothetical protein [Xanthobacteraceae bacterium]
FRWARQHRTSDLTFFRQLATKWRALSPSGQAANDQATGSSKKPYRPAFKPNGPNVRKSHVDFNARPDFPFLKG